MGRTPYGGRNWEGFSPDPYLTGVAMESGVRGLQDAGVQATIKHWLLYEQETQRSPTLYPNGTLEFSTYSSNADDRTIRKSTLFFGLPDGMAATLIWDCVPSELGALVIADSNPR